MSEYRKSIETTEELGTWYDVKYAEMGDGWNTPAEECNRHLNDLGVPFDKTKSLLDVGCGAGHFLVEAEKRVECSGVDISVVGVQLTKKRVSPLTATNVFTATIDDDLPSPVPVQFDFIVSMGSLEHVVDLDQALDNIHDLLKEDGKFYFFCPNESWKHFDQPNERTMTDAEWCDLFRKHGLYVHTAKRWNDSTAFTGKKVQPLPTKLNIGAGQRPFVQGYGWVNIDCVSRPPDQVPDLICDVGKEPLPYADNSIEMAVLHQVYEHFGLGEGHGLLREIHRVLQPGGSLIITVPNMRALAERWLTQQIDDYIYMVNLYGAYQGEPGDRHKWGYHRVSLIQDLHKAVPWTSVYHFNWRPIPGADIAKDWWVLGLEAVK